VKNPTQKKIVAYRLLTRLFALYRRGGGVPKMVFFNPAGATIGVKKKLGLLSKPARRQRSDRFSHIPTPLFL
jgi:hypothetical protein